MSYSRRRKHCRKGRNYLPQPLYRRNIPGPRLTPAMYDQGYGTEPWYAGMAYEHSMSPGQLLGPAQLRSILQPQEEARMQEIANWRANSDAKKGMFRHPMYIRQPTQAELLEAYVKSGQEGINVSGQGVVMGGDVMGAELMGGIYGNPYPFSFNYF